MKKIIRRSKNLFICPQSPMLIRVSIEVLDKPKKRGKDGCESCNEIVSRWLVDEIRLAFLEFSKKRN